MIHGNAGDGGPAGIMCNRVSFKPVDKRPEFQRWLVRDTLF